MVRSGIWTQIQVNPALAQNMYFISQFLGFGPFIEGDQLLQIYDFQILTQSPHVHLNTKIFFCSQTTARPYGIGSCTRLRTKRVSYLSARLETMYVIFHRFSNTFYGQN